MAEWWKVSETVVYTRGILGECPARGETSLSPIDTHPLPRQTVIAWALVYGERIEAEAFGRALSDVLRDYPMLAGRFGPDGKVLHNNGGVPVVVGKSSETSSDLSPTPILEDATVSTASARSPPPYLNPMNLSKVYQGKDAIVSFRLTYLGDGGTILGVTIPHAIVDGRSLACFLSALSLSYQGEEYPRPFLDRRVLTYQPLAETMTNDEIEAFHSEESVSFSDWNMLGSSRTDAKLDMAASVASGLSKYHSNRVHPSAEGAGVSASGGEKEEEEEDLAAKMSVWQSLGHLCRMFWQFAKGGKVRTVVVRIDKEELAAIKAECARASVPTEGGESVSRNDIAVAYAWILMRKLQDRLGHLKRTDREHQSRMLFAADLRVKDRMENLSETYFGNAALAVDIDGPRTMSLVDCAALVRRAVSNLKATKTKSIMRTVWRVSQESSLLRALPALVTTLPCYHDCFVTSWQFPFEAFTFGLGAPSALYPGMFPRCPWTAIVITDPSTTGGGVYIHMTLPATAHHILTSDPAVSSHMARASIVTG